MMFRHVTQAPRRMPPLSGFHLYYALVDVILRTHARSSSTLGSQVLTANEGDHHGLSERSSTPSHLQGRAFMPSFLIASIRNHMRGSSGRILSSLDGDMTSHGGSCVRRGLTTHHAIEVSKKRSSDLSHPPAAPSLVPEGERGTVPLEAVDDGVFRTSQHVLAFHAEHQAILSDPSRASETLQRIAFQWGADTGRGPSGWRVDDVDVGSSLSALLTSLEAK
jgi:hypothetical protein